MICMQVTFWAQSYPRVFGNSNEGIMLINDSTYFLYGYATLELGKYVINERQIQFEPFNSQARFNVYATVNTKIPSGARFNFIHFEKRPTFLCITNDTVARVFNEDFNCSSGPYMYYTKGPIEWVLVGDKDFQQDYIQYYFAENAVTYNDFILIYHPKTRYNQPFLGLLEDNNSKLKIEFYDGSKMTFAHEDLSTSEYDADFDKSIQLLLEQYSSGVRFANDHGSIYERTVWDNYTFNKTFNIYVANDYNSTYNEGYYYASDYNDYTVLRKYEQLVMTEQLAAPEFELSPQSIIYSSCEGDELNYEYGRTYINVYEETAVQEGNK